MHAIPCSQNRTSGSGPIRSNRSRKDTSPYGSERFSNSNIVSGGGGSGTGNAGGGGHHHQHQPNGGTGNASGSLLNIPDNAQWRRTKSDPFIVSSLNTNGGTSTGVSPAGSVGDTPAAILGSNGAISPLHGASPTIHRRGTGTSYYPILFWIMHPTSYLGALSKRDII